jgi:hypothetical protein
VCYWYVFIAISNQLLGIHFFILDIYHPDTLYLRGQECVVRGYFSKPKGVHERNKKFEKRHFKRLAQRPVINGRRS